MFYMKLTGQVIKGEGLGFKTANLKVNNSFYRSNKNRLLFCLLQYLLNNFINT